MSCAAILVGDGAIRHLSPEDAAAYRGRGFIWIHLEGTQEEDLAILSRQGIPDIAVSALVATETRPRCDRMDEGALINLRGPAADESAGTDRLVSVRLWAH